MIILLGSEAQNFWANYVHVRAKGNLCLFFNMGFDSS